MPKKDHFTLSVVVPCYNEETVIELTHKTIKQTLGGQSGFDLEVIYVDDGSQDGTAAIIEKLAHGDDQTQLVLLSRNFGHQAAVMAGMGAARGDVVAVMDADLQDPPDVILKMIAKWREGFEVVYGVRTQRKEGLLKRLTYASFYRMYRWLADIEVPLDSGDFSLMDRQVVDVMNGLPEINRFNRGLRSWAGFRQTGLVYERAARAAGDAKYSWGNLVALAFDGIFSFSTAPLRLIFIVGISVALLAAAFSVFYFLFGTLGFEVMGRDPKDVPGFTSLILAILFFSGVQLISIGILGEYLGRIYNEVKRRPIYVVKRGDQPRNDGEADGNERSNSGTGH